MDVLSALRLQIDWGVDEFLLDAPRDRRAAKAAPPPALKTPAVVVAPGLAGPQEAMRIAAACDTLEALREALDRFDGCSLRDTATQLVFADGAVDVRVMLIGEGPGAEEDRIGRPFVGPAGQLLDKMLAGIGLNRTKVRIANVVPWRPPGNRAPTLNEIAVCVPFLQRQIALVKPACLVLLGGTATKAMLPAPERDTGIRRLRGNWQRINVPGLESEIPSLPTYHPAYLLRTAAAKRDSWHDLIALREWLEHGE